MPACGQTHEPERVTVSFSLQIRKLKHRHEYSCLIPEPASASTLGASALPWADRASEVLRACFHLHDTAASASMTQITWDSSVEYSSAQHLWEQSQWGDELCPHGWSHSRRQAKKGTKFM